MKSYTVKAIDIQGIQEEMEFMYPSLDWSEIGLLLFGDYSNDCYKSLYLNYEWNPNCIYTYEDINDFLSKEEIDSINENEYIREMIVDRIKELFPNEERILIDVSW